MRFAKSTVLFAVAMFGCAAAGDDVPNAISKPGAFFGVWGATKATLVADPAIEGGVVERVTISPKPTNPWDIGAYAKISKPVKKGDVLLLSFWARAGDSVVKHDLITITGRISETGSSSSVISPDTSFVLNSEWKRYYTIGTAPKDYAVGELNAAIVLGTGDQVVEFGPVIVMDFGPNYDFGKLSRP